jgi:hypothetical protein
VLHHVDSSAETVVASGQEPIEFRPTHETVWWGQGGYGGSVPLPPGLPPGKYRVFYRFFEGDKAVGDGHFFEVELNEERLGRVKEP